MLKRQMYGRAGFDFLSDCCYQIITESGPEPVLDRYFRLRSRPSLTVGSGS
jgi:hypothetical protein